MDGPPAKAPRTAAPAQSDDSSSRTAPRSLTSLLDGLIWLNVSSYQSVKERLAMSCVCRAFYWAIYSLIRVINWHRPNHGLSCRGPGGSLVTFEQQQHAIILLPTKGEVEEIGRARLFAFVSLQLVNHTETLKAIQTVQPGERRDADEGAEDAPSDQPVAQVKGPDAVFPCVRSIAVDSLDGLHLFQQQKLVCPALERLTGEVLSGYEAERAAAMLSEDVGEWASTPPKFDGSLAFMLESSPALSHLDIFPLLYCPAWEGSVLDDQSSVVPLTTAALSSLRNLHHVGHLKLLGSHNTVVRNMETSMVVTLLRQLTPHSGGSVAASSSSASAAPPPSPSPSGAARKRQLKVTCPLEIVRDLVNLDKWSTGSVEAIQAAEEMGWEVVREGGTTSIDCSGAMTEGPPTAETLKLVETFKRHAKGGDGVMLEGCWIESPSPTSPYFSGIRFDSATRLNIQLTTAGPDVDAECFDCIPPWLTEETTLKSLSSVTELHLIDFGGPKGVSTCDLEYLIPPPTPNRLSRLLSSLPALTHVHLRWSTGGGVMASEVLAYIGQGIKAKPLKKLAIRRAKPLSFSRPRTKAAAPVAFPSPHTPRQYPAVQDLSMQISPIDHPMGDQDIYNPTAGSVPELLRDLFRLVHELRPEHATLKLSERADIFTAPGDADQIKSQLDSLFRQGRVRGDMPEYGMEVTRLAYERFDEEESSNRRYAQRPRQPQLTVEMEMRPVGDAAEEEGFEGMG
ncbi:unnamed protein product [Vitrella brassicaformis CCMP3155]|uniref:F-box domain-containing protein n=1 Tax=Vitrella brassicaformis (strain CCMP3155) TaxID=1169540 RepID=A0A0G4FEU1_VITBC|nr:unnamed protein product [Vitrella brassicaformis CCMP3155]|eukprot:CEM11332.1 unnamed protein product [Vitrella brassicaformis CCMP3155]